jgi:hypothetical protein
MAEENRQRREIILVNRTEAGPPSRWDYLERIAKILSLIAIPVILAVGGWWIQNALSQRTVSKDYVELAVSILSKPEGEVDTGLRAWAVDLLNANSPVPFEEEIAKKLSKGEVTLPTLHHSPWYQPISSLPKDDPRRKVSNSIGSLNIVSDSQKFICTAWVVSPGYVITANHCVHGREESLPQAIELVLGYLSENQTDAERFNISLKYNEVNRDLGYAILKVDGIPANEYDPIRLSSAPPKVGDPLFIAHHAGGKSKSFSVNPCKVLDVTNSEITHDCDTSAGVSGAPLIRTSDQPFQGDNIMI